VPETAPAQCQRRPQWRGERQALLVRVPVPVATAVKTAAAESDTSLSDFLAGLIKQSMTARQVPGRSA